MFHFGTSSKGRKKKKERATKEPTCAKIAQVRQEGNSKVKLTSHGDCPRVRYCAHHLPADLPLQYLFS